MESTSIKLPNKLSELFLVIADNKQDTTLVRKAKNDLFILINAWIWNRIMDVCTSGYVQDEAIARALLNEVWIEILNSSSSILKILKKNSKKDSEENILFLLIDKIIQEKKSIILADEIKYAKHHFLLNESITKEENDDDLEKIDKCNGDLNDHQEPETFEEDEDVRIGDDQDFIEMFLENGILRITNLSGEDLKSIKKWLTIELGKLSKRDKEVTLEYFNIKENRKNLDDKKIAYLCKQWETTPDNLLKIRSRTIEKLKAAFLRYVEQEHEKRERNPGKEGNNQRA